MAVSSIAEYTASIKTPQMVKAPVLAGGHPIMKSGRPVKYSGGFCVVFPYETSRKKYAVRCWHADIKDIQKRARIVSEAISASKLPYFVGFDFVPNGILTADGPQAIVVMDWVNAVPLKRYIANHIKESHVIRNLANSFKTMVEELHVLHWAHGDLQHGNILVRENGGLVLVDYDSMYVPALSGFSDDIKGIAGYQHPARWKNNTLNEAVDYFSELIIYTSLVALSKYPDLWNSLRLNDTETMLFSEDDLSSKGKSAIFKSLEQDSELIILVNRIKEFLAEERITRLLPLEQAIVDPIKAQVEDVSKLWKNTTTRSQPDYKAMADAVAKLW